MRVALITGSETFGSYVFNPTKWLALTAAGQIIADHKIHSLVFPSIIQLAPGQKDPGKIIIKQAQAINVDVIISFGMASDAQGFRIERSATNWIYSAKYLTEAENNQPIDLTRPDREQLQNTLEQWDLALMQRLFQENNLPFESVISDNPGQYSCNSWIYRTLLARQAQNCNKPYLFMHAACTPEAIECIPDFPRDKKILLQKADLLKALEIVLRSYQTV